MVLAQGQVAQKEPPLGPEVATLCRGRYHLLKDHKAGGQGWVYLARDSNDDQLVAIKVIFPDLYARYGFKVQRETLLVRGLSSPNVVRITDEFSVARRLTRSGAGPTWAYVMPWASENLAQLFARTTERNTVLGAVLGFARGLQVAHAAETCHNDVTPANVLRFGNEWAAADFFGATELPEGETTYINTWGADWHYLSPEWLTQYISSKQGDIWSLGMILHEGLTRTFPFEDETPSVIDISTELDPRDRTLIDKCLQPNRRKRPSIESVVATLTAIIDRSVVYLDDIPYFADELDHAEGPVHSGATRQAPTPSVPITPALTSAPIPTVQPAPGPVVLPPRVPVAGAPATDWTPRPSRARRILVKVLCAFVAIGILGAVGLGLTLHAVGWSVPTFESHVAALFRDWTHHHDRPGIAGSGLSAPGSPPSSPTHSAAPIVRPPSGYVLVDQDGNLYSFGDDANSVQSVYSNSPARITAITADPSISGGYWILQSDGTVDPDSAETHDFSLSSGELDSSPAISIASTPDGKGYWVLQSDGNVAGFGDAGALYTPNIAIPSVSISAQAGRTPNQDGYYVDYWVHGAAAGVGCPPGPQVPCSPELPGDYVAIVGDLSGNGYYLVESDGLVVAMGNAVSYGSAYKKVTSPVVGMALMRDGKGYWLVSADGAVYAFGDATYYGGVNLGKVLLAPIVGMVGG
jgi:hypothetical protein